MSTPIPSLVPLDNITCATGGTFQPAPLPLDEGERLAALRRLNLLDTAPSESFDMVTRLTSQALKVPTVLVSLVDENRQWFKSRVGVDVEQTGRDVSFCAHAIHERRPLVIPNATLDERFALNPLVLNEPHIRAYMGMPLFTRDGHPVGTLCVIDRQPRDFGEGELATLRSFARIIEEFMHARDLAQHADAAVRFAEDRQRLFRDTFEQAAVGIVHTSLTGQLLRINQRFCDMVGYPLAELTAMTFVDITYPDDLSASVENFQALLAGRQDSYRLEKRFVTRQGDIFWAHLSVALKRSESGAPDYLISVIEDVTDKKRIEADLLATRDSLQVQVELQTQKLKATNEALQAQVRKALDTARALRKAENRVRAIVNNMPAVIGYWNAQLRCEAANAAYRDVYGVVPERIVGMLMPEFLGAKLFKMNEPHVRAALNGKLQRFERCITRPDGSRTFLDTQYIPDIDESGTARGFYVLQTNVTDLRIAQLQLEASNAKLQTDSVTDYLTGLSNRRVFTERAELAAMMFVQSGRVFGLILIDLDNFKHINDHYGHDAGDDVLRALGRVLRRGLRGNADDLVARLGGEEFAILCSGELTAESLSRVAERVRAQIECETVNSSKGAIRFTGSFGLALSAPDDPDWRIVYARADGALYEAKEAGKNRISFCKTYSKNATGRLRALSITPPGSDD
jgi:diguanylate cyclase (GGDEF)-like protein/PAS domain S-box-containing protein